MLVVVLDSLHDNFEITIAPLLYSSDQNLKEIQQIVTFTEAINFAKHVIYQTADLAIMTKKTSQIGYHVHTKVSNAFIVARRDNT